jgi:UPF0716 family protein affecting phage T7 exclusion
LLLGRLRHALVPGLLESAFLLLLTLATAIVGFLLLRHARRLVSLVSTMHRH